MVMAPRPVTVTALSWDTLEVDTYMNMNIDPCSL